MAEVSGLSTNVSSRPNEKGSGLTTTSPMIDVKLALGWSRYSLRLIGLWPYQTCNKSHQRLLMRYGPPVCSMWSFAFDMVPQIFAPFVYSFDRNELITMIGIASGFFGALMRMMVVWSNSKVLAVCLAFLSDNWKGKLSTVDRTTIMRNTTVVRYISIGITILIQFFYWTYVIYRAAALLNLDLNDQNTTELGKHLFYPSYFPFDLRHWTNFLIFWSGQCIGLLWGTLAYQGVDGFVGMLIMHLCGQITMLRYAFIDLIDGDKALDRADFQVKLRVLVMRHNVLIDYVHVIKESLSPLLFFFIFSYTIQMCCLLFPLVEALTEYKPGEFPYTEVCFCIAHLNATVVYLFIYCYVGDALIQESEALGLAAYSCKWYNLSGSTANDLRIVMHRARVPLQMWAGKFAPFSLSLFSTISRTAMSYFSVLLTMKA